MYIELGTGQKNIVYYNAGNSAEVDLILSRIAKAYTCMLKMGYPDILKANRNCKMIFTSYSDNYKGIKINVSTQPCGIYTDKSAYHRQIARTFYTMTGLEIYERDSIDAAVEIGVGGMNVGVQGYVMLKEAVLGFANFV